MARSQQRKASPKKLPKKTPAKETAMKDDKSDLTAEQTRLQTDGSAWKRWGPYLSERQWGTVREDYSDGGTRGTTLPMIMHVPGPIDGARTAWAGSPTISSGSVSRLLCGTGKTRFSRNDSSG